MAKVTQQNIDKELARQGTAPEGLPPAAQRDALAGLATGILNASLGAPGIPQEKVREQIIANVVWAYLYPQDPRDVHAAMMPRLVAQNFAERGALKPSKDAVTALAEVAIGWIHEGRWPSPSMGRLLAAQAAVNYYLAGA
jgi:hypothetical protein